MSKDAAPTWAEFESHSFFRPLDWRLQRARYLLDHDRLPSTQTDDDESISVFRILSAEARCCMDRDRAQLEQEWPAFLAARRLTQAEELLRWEVQARILARQTDEEVAAQCELTPQTVHWFEAVFFCVRDRLDARDWIAARVIGPGLWRGFAPEEMGQLWAYFGYNAGPLALDVIIAASPTKRNQDGRAAQQFPASVMRSAELAIAAMMIPANASFRQLAELHASLRRLEMLPRRVPNLHAVPEAIHSTDTTSREKTDRPPTTAAVA